MLFLIIGLRDSLFRELEQVRRGKIGRNCLRKVNKGGAIWVV